MYFLFDETSFLDAGNKQSFCGIWIISYFNDETCTSSLDAGNKKTILQDTLAIHASYRGDSSYKHTISIVDFQALPLSGVLKGEDGSVPSCFTGNMWSWVWVVGAYAPASAIFLFLLFLQQQNKTSNPSNITTIGTTILPTMYAALVPLHPPISHWHICEISCSLQNDTFETDHRIESFLTSIARTSKAFTRRHIAVTSTTL